MNRQDTLTPSLIINRYSSGGGSGTISGSLAVNQVAFGSGTDTISGSANFLYDTAGTFSVGFATNGTTISIDDGASKRIREITDGSWAVQNATGNFFLFSDNANKLISLGDVSGAFGAGKVIIDAVGNTATSSTLTWSFGGTKLINVLDPTTNQDAATKIYVDTQVAAVSGALTYLGLWNANTNSPTIVSSTGTTNTYYVVSVAGTTSIDGISTWNVGDFIIFNGTVWQRLVGGSGYFAGAGLALVGSTFSLDVTHANNWSGLQSFESDTFRLKGNVSGSLKLNAAATTTAYNLYYPSTQGAINTVMVNDGSGNLSNTGAAILTAQISISSADILALNTTPKVLVAAQGAGTIIVPVSTIIKYTFGGSQYSGSSMRLLQHSFPSTVNTSAFNSTYTGTGSAISYFTPLANPAQDIITNQPLRLWVGTSDPTAGNGIAVITVRYMVLTP